MSFLTIEVTCCGCLRDLYSMNSFNSLSYYSCDFSDQRTCCMKILHLLPVMALVMDMAVGENDGYDAILHKISRYDTICNPKTLCRM